MNAVSSMLAELGEVSSWFLLAAAVAYILAIGEGKKSRAWFLAGIGLHLANILGRWVTLGFPPLAEKHDNISLVGLSIALGVLYSHRRRRDDRLFLYGSPLVVVFLFVAFLTRRIDAVSPFLDTPWFYLHSLSFFGGIGLLGASAIPGFFYLMGGEAHDEAIQYRLAADGWVLYTVSLVLGSIWFFMAYGTYWLWTSREMWSMLTWFHLGLYLHARLMRGWRGRPAAALGVIGFGLALFTYFGVGTIIPSPPTPF